MLKYKITEKTGVNFYSNLIEASSDQLYSEKHSIILPHPADIIREKIDSLEKSLRRLHKSIADKKTAPDSSSNNDNEIIQNTKDFIISFDGFYDSTALIIKCFAKPVEPDNKNAFIWLAANKSLAYQKFLGATKSNHKLFSSMADVIKHSHADISLITVKNHKNVEVLGFYIKKVIGEGDLRGPDPSIHPLYREVVHTAISFNHLSLNAIGLIFHYIHWLNKSIFGGIKPKKEHPFSALYLLVSNSKVIDEQFFPDEYLKTYGRISVGDQGFKVEYPYKYLRQLNENWNLIKSTNGPLLVNERTNISHSVLPYLQLIYKRHPM